MWKFAPVFFSNRNPNAPLSQQAPSAPQQGTPHGSNPALFEARGSGQFAPYYCPSVGQHHSSSDVASDPLTQCIATFYWLAVLVFVSYPVALVAIIVFIFVSPLASLSSRFVACNEFLLKVAHFPAQCTKNLIRAKSPACLP